MSGRTVSSRASRGATWSSLLLAAFAVAAVVSPAPVLAVGLFAASVHPDLVHPSTVAPLSSPTCSSYGLCPADVTSAYGMSSLLGNATTNGTGQTVVIVDACGDANIVSDLSTFDSAFGLADPTLSIYQPQGTPCSDPTGWGLETALDVEWSHVMAPGASIALVEAKSASNANLFGAWNYSLVNGLGLTISNSWGGTGGCPSTARTLLASAQASHVTVLASSGDSAAWGYGTKRTIQEPADCANVLAVGGTSLSINSSGGYGGESAWSGGGGGYVTGVREPAYQARVNITDSSGYLGKPDVAAVADPSTGVWVYEKSSGGWLPVGGTSVACPIWAGYLADINGWRAAKSFPGLGDLIPFLYKAVYGVNGGSPAYATSFHDVTSGSNGWSAGAGWDAATGLGSMQGAALAALLAAIRAA
ncbi:MAG TPA: S53 family peptidase [Thermoplasmata archaeon]|nr:S53 family peptidase [Thermoplasmata archaeon]